VAVGRTAIARDSILMATTHAAKWRAVAGGTLTGARSRHVDVHAAPRSLKMQATPLRALRPGLFARAVRDVWDMGTVAARSGGHAGDLRGGVSGATVSLGILLPLGLLAYAALGVDAGPVGVRAAFITAVAGGLVATLIGGADVPGSGPKTSTALILAGFIATLVADPRLRGSDGLHVETIVLLASLCVGVSGVLQIAFALLRMGSAVSFVPRPVVAGFMDGIAILIAIAQFETLLGVHRAGGTAESAHTATGLQSAGLALGLATAALCWITARRWPRAPWGLVGIVAGAAAFQVLTSALPDGAFGPLLGTPAASLAPPIAVLWRTAPEIAPLVRDHLLQLLTTSTVIAIIGSMDGLLSAVAVDTRLNTRHDSNRLLLGVGLGNLVCAALGGIPVGTSSAVQLAAHRAGGHGRGSGIVCVGTLLLILVVGGPALGGVPVAVTAGVMLVVALGLFDQWSRSLWRQLRGGSRERDTLWSLAIALIVCVCTIVLGFVIGIVVGVVLSLVLFVSQLNRSLVRSVATGEIRGSRRIYLPEQAQVLRERGKEICVVELEGAIFFGTAHLFERDMEQLSAGARFLILDVRRVTMLDASGAFALQRLAARIRARGATLLLAGIVPGDRHARALGAYGAFGRSVEGNWHADSDRALEHAERALLADAGVRPLAAELPLAALSLLADMDEAQRAALAQHLSRVELATGEILFRRGEPGDRLYVLARGSVSILADLADGVAAAHRLASFVPGVIFGEAAMLDGGGRSAGAAADEPSVVYVLTRADLDAIRERDPALANVVLLNIARQLSARLRFATATIQAAER
jgi:SulP family sulfate permease